MAARRDPVVESRLVALFDATRGDELRLLLIDSLVRIQGLAAVPFLIPALSAGARRVRIGAATALGSVCALPGQAATPAGHPDDEGGPDGKGGPDRRRTGGRGAGVWVPPSRGATCGSACAALNARLQVEADEGVRQALIEALHRADPRPRRFWERWTGRRPWAEAEPQATALPGAAPARTGPLCGSAVARRSRSRAAGRAHSALAACGGGPALG